MEISLEELLQGRATIIKNKEYLSTEEYVTPFLNLTNAFVDEYKITVKTPTQITKKNDQEDITYNRVLIQGTLPPEHNYDNHNEVVGFLYGLDCKTPVVKIYRGYMNRACMNLSVFSPTWLNVQEIQPEKEINYNIHELLNLANNFKNDLQQLKSVIFEREQMYESLGGWVDFCLRNYYDNGIHKVSITPTLPIKAYKSLFVNEKSNYYIREEREPTLFDVHEAMTQVITDDSKDLINPFEKTLLVNQMLGIA